MPKNWKSYLVVFALGSILCGGVVFWIAHSAGARLNADLASARSSLAKSANDNIAATLTVRQLYSELDGANKLADSQQRIIASQRGFLAIQQRAIDAIAQSISSAGGDIKKSIDALAGGFERLYEIYHPGAGPGKSP